MLTMNTFKSCSPGVILILSRPMTLSTARRKTWPCSIFHAESVSSLRLPSGSFIQTLILDLATGVQTKRLYLTLLTLLFSYAYDARSTQLDPTSESAWTISVLTPAFSALDPPPYNAPSDRGAEEVSILDISDALRPSYRRSLAFPLYRSFAFSEGCRADVAKFLLRGKRVVLRCLLEMKDILDHHDTYYVYSKIWLEDFCVWIQVDARSVKLYKSRESN